ncbi:hypothetical protein OG21DRAFT_976060 [Imleria badia]|nr:hypothetical protein OG21DRAFT_976060 [Imleria badia]
MSQVVVESLSVSIAIRSCITLLWIVTTQSVPQKQAVCHGWALFRLFLSPRCAPDMGDSERYVPPPPPYELSLDPDQKVSEPQAHDIGPFPGRDEEKDSKYFRALSDKLQREVALPNNPKRLVRSVSGNLRAPRPLPLSPADTRSRGHGGIVGSVADLKSFAAQNDHATEHPPVPPPFSAIGPPLDEVSYTQSMRHSSPSVHPSPFHCPSQPSHDVPRRSFDDR